MADSIYQFGTSPRKVEPEIKKKNQKGRLRVLEDLPRQDIKISKMQRKKQIKATCFVIAMFILLLTISYRNSQINESFSEVQTLKKQLATLEKENEQAKVSIENSLNLSYIEQEAKTKLGMQKLTNKQTVYISLPKKDYVEASTEEVELDEEKNWFEEILDKIFHK